MLETKSININTINKNFKHFKIHALKEKNPTAAFVVSQLQKYEKSYKRAGSMGDYIVRTQELAEDFDKRGLTDLTGIIYASLIKIKILPDDIKEIFIKRAFEIAQKQNDVIHQLGRTVDLKMLYRKDINNRRKDYIKNLFTEEKLLRTIVRNFETSSDNFKTISKNAKNKDEYNFRLGLAKVEIAKQYLYTNKKIALEKLTEALKIFRKLGKTNEEYSTQGLIENLKH
ncbi:MAG: hypothetical protein E7Z89_02285 [Cyanobacteria bacterium SIG28]|nr:hypothetical protein [Cyanobacteria bacterium SIG28]